MGDVERLATSMRGMAGARPAPASWEVCRECERKLDILAASISSSMSSMESAVVFRRCVAEVENFEVCFDVVGSCTEREILVR